MPDSPYEPHFHVSFPSWLLVRKDCVGKTKGGTTGFVKKPVWLTLKGKEGNKSVPVFTDEETAVSFCEASPGLLDEATMINADDGQQLADMLELIAGTDKAENVVLDPKSETAGSRHVWAIEYAVERLRSGLDL
jgi:hypothetical protein